LSETKWKKAGSVVGREIEGEAVLLNLKSGVYYSLNQVGTYIWSLFEAGTTESQLTEAVEDEYEVDGEEASRDVGELIRDLSGEGLIEKAAEKGQK